MRRLGCMAVVLFMTAEGVTAADIQIVNPSRLSAEQVFEGTCSITLTGVIQKGDADRLERLIESNFPQEHGEVGETVCLDSPGGSLDEGVNIARVLERQYTSTIVPAGASCLSACAVAFMGGNFAWYEYWFNARYMHASATVGFHAPTLEVRDGSYNKQTVEKAFNIAITAVGRVANEMSDTLHGSTIAKFPQSLFGAMLSHHGSDFLYIDTVEKAANWDIGVIGARSASPKENLESLCFSVERWLVDAPVLDFEDQAWILEEELFAEVRNTGAQSWHLTYGGMFISECFVEQNEVGGFTVKISVDEVDQGEGSYSGWAAFPPNTKLSSLR